MIRKSVLSNGVRILTEDMPSMVSSTIGIWVENGSRYEDAGRERPLALHRASAVQGHQEAHRGANRGRDRCGRRRAQRLHRQGIHLLLRQGPRRRPQDGDRAARGHLPRIGVRSRRNRARAPGRDPGNLAGRGHARRFHPRPLQPGFLEGASAGAADFRLARHRQHFRSRGGGDRSWRSAIAPSASSFRRPARSITTRWCASASGSSTRSPATARPTKSPRRARIRTCSISRRTSSRRTSVMGGPGLSYTDPLRYASYVMNTALGGGMSSRLFQEVREKRGRVYSIYSFMTLMRRYRLRRGLRRHQSRMGRRSYRGHARTSSRRSSATALRSRSSTARRARSRATCCSGWNPLTAG